MDKIDFRKTIFIYFCFALGFFLVLSKAFYVQIINSKSLIAYSNDQLLRTSTVFPYRGQIYDRFMTPLAINIQTYSIFAIPKQMKSRDRVIRDLLNIIPSLNKTKISKLIHERSNYTFIARKVSLNETQIEMLKKVEGVFFDAVPKRIYPNNESMAQILGFVGVDNSGLAGLEYIYDKELRGRPKITRYFRDAKGRPIKMESIQVESEAEELQLTIDRELQGITEKYLKEAVDTHQALSGGAGVLDVRTGEILAMANYPSFNPNEVESGSPANRRPSFVTDPIEPGSIFKTLTIAAALEHRVATPSTKFYCERGKFRVQNHVISEAETHEVFEWLSVSDILKFSSNIGSTKIAFALGFPKLKETLLKFGIGQKTGIELSGESKGIFTSKDRVPPLSLSNISFGQGIAMTPIQILKAYGIIASGGCNVHPHLIYTEQSENINKEEKKCERVISEQTAKSLQEMLQLVVEKGTGSSASIPYFKIGGKTSTAQKAKPSGGYEGYIGGFAGFPIGLENPFVVFVYIDRPTKGGYYGGVVAAPVFKKITQYLLYKDIDELSAMKKEAKKVTKDLPTAPPIVESAREVKAGFVPNFIGLDKRSAEDLAEEAGIPVKFVGAGIVYEQSISNGQEHNGMQGDVVLKCRVPRYEEF